MGNDRPLMFFAGIWVPQWKAVRKVKEGGVTTNLFACLTTEANAEVAPIHPKAMPVILTQADELEAWLAAPWAVAKELQRPLSDGMLSVVARDKSDQFPDHDDTDPTCRRKGAGQSDLGPASGSACACVQHLGSLEALRTAPCSPAALRANTSMRAGTRASLAPLKRASTHATASKRSLEL
jgi:hypothetical protein